MNKDGFKPNQPLTPEQVAELKRKYANENTQAETVKNTKPKRATKDKSED